MNFIELSEYTHRLGNATYLSFSMQRSGQHLIIDWICRGLGDVAHFNHCRLYLMLGGLRLEPMMGRISAYYNGDFMDSGKIGRAAVSKVVRKLSYSQEFYSMEDVLPTDIGYRRLCDCYGRPTIVILRDPANWLASALKHPKSTHARVRRKLHKLKNLLEIAIRGSSLDNVVFVSFNRFISDSGYRAELAIRLGVALDNAEMALNGVPDFGGGSSFGVRGRSAIAGVGDRWREYEDDPFYRNLLADTRLRLLSQEFFGQDFMQFLD